MVLPEQMPDSSSLFLRSWLLSYAKHRHLLSPRQKTEVWKALEEHLEKVDRVDRALAKMAAKGRGERSRRS